MNMQESNTVLEDKIVQIKLDEITKSVLFLMNGF